MHKQYTLYHKVSNKEHHTLPRDRPWLADYKKCSGLVNITPTRLVCLTMVVFLCKDLNAISYSNVMFLFTQKEVMVTPWRMKSPDKVVNYCTEIINKNKKYPCYHSTKIIWNKMTKGLIKQADSKCIRIISVINHHLTFKHFDFLWPFWMLTWNVHPQIVQIQIVHAIPLAQT